jgi:hypothetical protein
MEIPPQLAQLDPRRLLQVVMSHRQEVSSQLRTKLLMQSLMPALHDAHEYDSSPMEFDFFDTVPSVGTGQITSTVGGADVTLFASVPSQSEAGLIVIQRANQWTSAAGTGGWYSWSVVNLSWSLNNRDSFSQDYNATPSTGYGPLDVFASDLARLKAYKPLNGRTIPSGGSITARLIVRPIGIPGTIAVFPGATITTISSAACNLWQKMVIMGNAQFVPMWVKAMFQGCNASCAGGGSGLEGRKAVVSRILGSGNIGKLLGSLHTIIKGETGQPTQ